MEQFLTSLPAPVMLLLSLLAPFWIWRWTPKLRLFLRERRYGWAAMSGFWVLVGVAVMALGCMNTALRFGYGPLWMFVVLPILIPLAVWQVEDSKGT